MNRLQHETSPYLLQHRENPVDWYPWGEEAFKRAREDDKPILLSVGYSACHWCHVMAHESFEHEPTAQMMNDLFVNIKVDREERPDVDDIYMQAVQAMNRGSGGWPMTVFLLPDGRPFYGGTYYPREPRHGMPSFRQVLEAVHDAFVNKRDDLEEQAGSLTRALDRSRLNISVGEGVLNDSLREKAAAVMLKQVDRTHGGFGSAPKFPNPMNLEFLLRYYLRAGSDEALSALELSLKRMARGGIYDQIGGGFHRYSVDAEWLVPHFEKMLYDNAQLSRIYLRMWQLTGDEFYRRVAEDVYDYVLREMTAPEGGFYSATDADSEGEEGKFFVWTIDELRDALQPIDDDGTLAETAIAYYGMTPGGNFEGTNILYVPHEPDDVAAQLDIDADTLTERLTAINDRLYAARTQREYPGLDDKILTAWNGMMLASLTEAAAVLGREDYLMAAERAGEFLLDNMLREGGRLYRTYNRGEARLNGYLEDYAHMIDAMLQLYQATFLDKWFKVAVDLAQAVQEHFAAEDGGYFDTSSDHETLIVRPRSLQDNAVPSGNSIMAKQFLRLAAYTGEAMYHQAAGQILTPMAPALEQYPHAFGEALNALDMLLSGLDEIAIVGNPAQPATRDLLSIIRGTYRPNAIIALARHDTGTEPVIPLLHHRKMIDDAPTVYVCRNFACKLPVNSPDALRELLGSA